MKQEANGEDEDKDKDCESSVSIEQTKDDLTSIRQTSLRKNKNEQNIFELNLVKEFNT